MDTFEPLINLLVLMTVLSVAAERVSNLIKARQPALWKRQETKEAERDREAKIQMRAVLVGIAVAVLAKADLFSILANLSDPFGTLGWVRVSGSQWFRSPATATLGTTLYAIGGSILTGLALGFGSRFWHEILSTVFELRTIARNRGSDAPQVAPAAAQGGAPRRKGGKNV